MSTIEEFRIQFENLNLKVSIPVLEKCVELSTLYNFELEDFIDEWLAFSASKLNGAAPTIDALEQMERKELKKRIGSVVNTPKNVTINNPATPIKVATPLRQNLKKELYQEESVQMENEGISHSQISIPSQNWDERSDAGKILETYGKCGSDTFNQLSKELLYIKIKNGVVDNNKYMHQKFLSKRASLESMYRLVITDILQQCNLQLTYENLTQYSGEMVICGRIISDTCGRLEQASIQLEGVLDIYKGQRVKLNLNKVEKVTLFNGQAVVVVGNNMKDSFKVEQIYTKCLLPPPGSIGITENLQIMVACGPFTLPTNLLYEPLQSLLNYVNEFKPNLLILMGPFLEDSHQLVENMNEVFDDFFENIIGVFVEKLSGSDVQIILVPSHKDIHNHSIFPNLPYKLKNKYDSLFLAPNPFIIDVNGLRIGGSTADVLFHLGKFEFTKGPCHERINNLISHLFGQKSFYPLYPPASELRVDYQLLEQSGMIENQLHLMFLPSNFKYFVKTVEGCVVVNPERVTKGSSGGTFARIEIRSSGDDISERVITRIYRI